MNENERVTNKSKRNKCPFRKLSQDFERLTKEVLEEDDNDEDSTKSDGDKDLGKNLNSFKPGIECSMTSLDELENFEDIGDENGRGGYIQDSIAVDDRKYAKDVIDVNTAPNAGDKSLEIDKITRDKMIENISISQTNFKDRKDLNNVSKESFVPIDHVDTMLPNVNRIVKSSRPATAPTRSHKKGNQIVLSPESPMPRQSSTTELRSGNFFRINDTLNTLTRSAKSRSASKLLPPELNFVRELIGLEAATKKFDCKHLLGHKSSLSRSAFDVVSCRTDACLEGIKKAKRQESYGDVVASRGKIGKIGVELDVQREQLGNRHDRKSGEAEGGFGIKNGQNGNNAKFNKTEVSNFLLFEKEAMKLRMERWKEMNEEKLKQQFARKQIDLQKKREEDRRRIERLREEKCSQEERFLKEEEIIGKKNRRDLGGVWGEERGGGEEGNGSDGLNRKPLSWHTIKAIHYDSSQADDSSSTRSGTLSSLFSAESGKQKDLGLFNLGGQIDKGSEVTLKPDEENNFLERSMDDNERNRGIMENKKKGKEKERLKHEDSKKENYKVLEKQLKMTKQLTKLETNKNETQVPTESDLSGFGTPGLSDVMTTDDDVFDDPDGIQIMSEEVHVKNVLDPFECATIEMVDDEDDDESDDEEEEEGEEETYLKEKEKKQKTEKEMWHDMKVNIKYEVDIGEDGNDTLKKHRKNEEICRNEIELGQTEYEKISARSELLSEKERGLFDIRQERSHPQDEEGSLNEQRQMIKEKQLKLHWKKKKFLQEKNAGRKENEEYRNTLLECLREPAKSERFWKDQSERENTQQRQAEYLTTQLQTQRLDQQLEQQSLQILQPQLNGKDASTERSVPIMQSPPSPVLTSPKRNLRSSNDKLSEFSRTSHGINNETSKNAPSSPVSPRAPVNLLWCNKKEKEETTVDYLFSYHDNEARKRIHWCLSPYYSTMVNTFPIATPHSAQGNRDCCNYCSYPLGNEKDIVDVYFLEGSYHRDCFKCSSCLLPFNNVSIPTKSRGLFYCQHCFRKANS